jgi:carbamoyltransferase
MTRNYIGIANTFHDSSIAVVDSKGRIAFAEATERYLQNKRSINNVPDQSVRIKEIVSEYCENDIDSLVIAHTWSEDNLIYLNNNDTYSSLADFVRRGNRSDIPGSLLDILNISTYVKDSLSTYVELSTKTLKYELNLIDNISFCNDYIVKRYDHHLTHAATACFTSPFSEGICAIIDGYGGKKSTTSCYTYRYGKIEAIKESFDSRISSISLGLFYMIICNLCGFGLFRGEEWKVMGLAAYGSFDEKIYDLLNSVINVKGITLVSGSSPYKSISKIYEHRRKNGGSPLQVANLAYTGQLVFSEIVYEYLNNIYELHESDNIILGGGCLLNSSTNGEILKKTKFKNAYIFSAPADDGNSIGAALLAYYEDHPEERRNQIFQSPYLGSTISCESIENLKRYGRIHKLRTLPGEIYAKTAELLSQGKIVGWVQGRAEFGPRALGNRSILADPRPHTIKDQINSRVKFREEFRPFAPSILHQFGHQYFEDYQESPYMERTLRFRRSVLERVPGVVHVDHTGRLQTVKKEWNERYYNLLNEFYKLTDVPMLLNTSFNIMGKPIIHSLEDAIAVFYTSGLDALVIDDLLIEK